MNWYEFLLRNRSEVFERSVEHIGLVGASMAIALVIGLPLGVALVPAATLQRWVLGAANVVQTIPSLALFGFLIPVPWIGGVGASTAIVALSLYALLPILRNTCTGIAEVDPAVIESARGMGMTPRQVLWQVQLPLAAPVMLAGIRVATVISIGVTTIAAAIGAGGLGVFIFRGVAMVNNQVILAGAIPAAAWRSWPIPDWDIFSGAAPEDEWRQLFDEELWRRRPPGDFSESIHCKTRRDAGATKTSAPLRDSEELHFAARIRRADWGFGSLVLCIFALLLMLAAGGCGKRGGDTIVVGSKNFTEQILLAEMFASAD